MRIEIDKNGMTVFSTDRFAVGNCPTCGGTPSVILRKTQGFGRTCGHYPDAEIFDDSFEGLRDAAQRLKAIVEDAMSKSPE
jgi:hypothetical protein